MKKIIEYWPLLTACILYIGFCNLHYYYKVFNLEIFSFVTTADILLSLFPQLVIISTTFYGLILQQLYSEIKKPTENQQTIPEAIIEKKQKRLLWFKKNIEIVVLIYFVVIILIMLLLKNVFHYKSYELTYFNIYTDIIFLFLIYIAVSIADRNKLFFEKPLLIGLFLLIFIGQKIGSYKTNEGLAVKDGITDYKRGHISFDYNGKNITSSDSLLLVGQTASYLFLYDRKDSSTKIFKNEKVENLIIK